MDKSDTQTTTLPRTFRPSISPSTSTSDPRQVGRARAVRRSVPVAVLLLVRSGDVPVPLRLTRSPAGRRRVPSTRWKGEVEVGPRRTVDERLLDALLRELLREDLLLHRTSVRRVDDAATAAVEIAVP